MFIFTRPLIFDTEKKELIPSIWVQEGFKVFIYNSLLSKKLLSITEAKMFFSSFWPEKYHSKFKSEICLKIGQCIAMLLRFLNWFSGNLYSLFLVLKYSVKFNVKLTRTKNNLIIVKSFLNIFGFLFVKLFIELFKYLLIRT